MRSPARTEKDGTGVVAPAARLPLSTLLSQTLVAFTIEFDNEFERRMPHRTSTSRSVGAPRDAPWLVSLAMWSNFMRLVGEEGLSIEALERAARTKPLLAGMERWGYVVVAPDPADRRPKPPRSEWVVRPTAQGRKAQEVWRPLFGVIEQRWQARFGEGEIAGLREALSALVRRLDVELPEFLPVLGYGMFAEVFDPEKRPPAGDDDGVAAGLHLPALLSQVLHTFTIDFERESELSLAICANVLRLLSEEGVRVRDLPRRSGVSKEAIQMALGFLGKQRCVAVEPDPTASRGRRARLTVKGREARDAYRPRLAALEERWQARFGEDAIRNLRESLERLAGEPIAERSPLFAGLEPHPDGWRAAVRRPETLPHHPMVLHRGGFPDGA